MGEVEVVPWKIYRDPESQNTCAKSAGTAYEKNGGEDCGWKYFWYK